MAILFAILEFPDILVSTGINVGTLTMWVAVFESPHVFFTARSCVGTLAMELAVISRTIRSGDSLLVREVCHVTRRE